MEQHKILIADDDVAISRMVRRFLEQAGYQVTSASDGAEAWAAVQREKPDLVVLDVAMPRMTGWEVLSHIRDHDELRGLPVLMLTALDTDADVTRGWVLGADFYLPKPFRGEELVEVVRRLLLGERSEEATGGESA